MPKIIESEAGKERRETARRNKQLSRQKEAAARKTSMKKATRAVPMRKSKSDGYTIPKSSTSKVDDLSASVFFNPQFSASVPLVNASHVETVVFEGLGHYENILHSNSLSRTTIKGALIGL